MTDITIIVNYVHTNVNGIFLFETTPKALMCED